MNEPENMQNPLGIHTACGPLNIAGSPIHHHLWPMTADHKKRYRPVEYVGKHKKPASRSDD